MYRNAGIAALACLGEFLPMRKYQRLTTLSCPIHGCPTNQPSHLLTAAVSLASAQYYGSPGAGYGGYGGGASGGSGDSSGSSTDFGGFSRGGFGFGPGFDVTTATRYRTIHGILACLAFAVLFPIGAIFMRLVPGRFAIWIHAATQVVAYIVFIAGAALGFWMIQQVQIPFAGGSLVS
jgi:hypothetical protein